MPTRFRWTTKSELAASLVAQGELTLAQIGERVGVDRKTLFAWRNDPSFQAAVADELQVFRDEVRRLGIAALEQRVQALNVRWHKMQRVIQERADDPAMKAVPGGTTGLMVRNVKVIGRGDDFQMLELFEVDTGLLRELREHEKQAAQELGQWVTKLQANPTKDEKPVDPDVAAAAIAGGLVVADAKEAELSVLANLR